MGDLRLTEIAERTRLSLRYWQRQAAAGVIPGTRYVQCGKRRVYFVGADGFASWWTSTPEEKAAWLTEVRERSSLESARIAHLTEAIRLTATVETSQVYFMESGGHVKIGHSSNLSKRLSEIRLANPAAVSLLGVIPGGEEREGRIHRTLDGLGHRCRGEWYVLTDVLRGAINLLLRKQ